MQKLSFTLLYFFILSLLILLFVNNIVANTHKSNIILENKEFRLVFSDKGIAKSLIHKKSGEECFYENINLPAFSITQDMPYDNEIKLTYPAKPKTFEADTLYWEGENLIVGFELTDYEAVINLNVTEFYIGFNLEKFRYKMATIGDKRKTKIDEFVFLQLPIKNRKHFGEWLNVSWDDKIAVNLLATNQYCRIDAQKRIGYKIFQAGGENEVRITNIGAALIVTEKKRILEHIDKIEHDYNLPLGVESRKRKEYKNSSYTPRGILTTKNIDEHIYYAKQADLKNFIIYYPSFAKTTGHFEWRNEYPNGIKDLKQIVKKIKNAGMLPGLHIHYNKATYTDLYVSPIPDGRLNIRRVFTLRKKIDKHTETIIVQENPYGCTLAKGRRILKIGQELFSYEKYTTEAPYKFLNCKRGIYNTQPVSEEEGTLLGLLDVDTWPVFVRFNQNTDIQDEVSKRIANIIDECGFRFLYFDGAEDVNPPFWYNITKAQLSIYKAMKTKPLFAEGALKTHYGWHLLTRGNAFDTFYPEDIKEATRLYPIAEIEKISNDFSSIDFGWNNYVAPGQKLGRVDVNYKSPKMEWNIPILKNETTIGIQPDMLEYVTSKAAAWNCPITLVSQLDIMKKHPRTKDNLEVISRWEKIREIKFLTKEDRERLKDNSKEYTLLKNKEGNFELIEYEQIKTITKENSVVRAFIFNRKNKIWVVYWHISGSANMEIPVSASKIKLYKEIGREIKLQRDTENVTVPVGDKRYLKFDLSRVEVLDILSRIKIK